MSLILTILLLPLKVENHALNVIAKLRLAQLMSSQPVSWDITLRIKPVLHANPTSVPSVETMENVLNAKPVMLLILPITLFNV